MTYKKWQTFEYRKNNNSYFPVAVHKDKNLDSYKGKMRQNLVWIPLKLSVRVRRKVSVKIQMKMKAASGPFWVN